MIRRADFVPPALLATLLALAAGCASVPPGDDATSDAPASRIADASRVKPARTYPEALATWRSMEDLNAWIGVRFEYDRERALALSETQRSRNGRVTIHAPESFFERPSGVCVDLARFAVETLRRIDPEGKPRYVMIEFEPVSISGNTLRRHWLVSVERDGQRHFFADSKRPGHVAGPYASTEDFIRDYAAYRGRAIVAWREADSYERRMRASARQPRPAP